MNLINKRVSLYAIPDLVSQQVGKDKIYTPSLIKMTVESEFNIPFGQLWFKTRSGQFPFARYTFLYLLQVKLGIQPMVIRVIYGVKHDKCYQARLTVDNILSSKTPRHIYIKITKLKDRIKQWDLTEISQEFEFLCARNVVEPGYKRCILQHSIREAQYIQQKNAQSVMEQAELSEQ